MLNYFNYFTEIEARFQQRRGSLLMLSTLDWALIETWREGGIPLDAVLRGIDNAFDKYDLRARRAQGRLRRVNGLAWCAQSVMEAAEQAMEAAVGASSTPTSENSNSGFESERISRYLLENARVLDAARLPPPADAIAAELSQRLKALASGIELDSSASLEDLDRTLTVLEEKLFAALLTSSSEDQLTRLREQAARELSPYKGKMKAVQIKQVEQQFLQKRLLEGRNLPRLSLFYMSLTE